MTSIAKLKDKARKYEQKEDWKAAIQAYQKVLEEEEGQDELELELALYNRIGDLFLRVGETDDAVSYYVTAADKYAEAGFINNAIALCNKALRHRPDRAPIYLKLSHLCAEQGFRTDARRWIIEYAQREVKLGHVEAAFEALGEFVESAGDPEVRAMLAGQLASHDRVDEAVEQYTRAYSEFLAEGDSQAAERIGAQARALDPDVELPVAAPPEKGEEPSEEPAGFAGTELPEADLALETHRQDAAELDEVGAMEGLERIGGDVGPGPEEPEEEMSGLEVGFSERPAAARPEDVEAGSLGGLETFDTGADEPDDRTAGAGVAPVAGGGEEPEPVDEEPEPLPLMDTGLDEEESGEPLPLLDTGYEEEEPEEGEEEAEPLPTLDFGDFGEAGEAEEPASARSAGPEAGAASAGGMTLDLGSLDLGFGGPAEQEEGSVTASEDLDVEAVLTRARELVSRGLTGEALRELRLLSGSGASPETFRHALAVVNEVVRHDANDVAALQRRVEYSAGTGDRDLLTGAYLDLADALTRLGAETKAMAMYQRVLDLDPQNEAAREAVYGPDAVAAEEEETVDLDAILREMGPEEARTPEEEAGSEESDPAFAAMLSQFKSRVNETVEAGDAGDHYDLGLAFKEMGLVDEAIAEFQTALTGGEERLKVYEELGRCFILKGQYTVALKVLTRALQVPAGDESELLGVYYHLGQCYEELGKRPEAREAYEKVLAVDEDFQDVPERVARL